MVVVVWMWVYWFCMARSSFGDLSCIPYATLDRLHSLHFCITVILPRAHREHTHKQMRTHTHRVICIHTHKHTHAQIQIYPYKHRNTYSHTDTRTHTNTKTDLAETHRKSHTYVHTHTNTRAHSNHAHTGTHMQTLTHSCKHSYCTLDLESFNCSHTTISNALFVQDTFFLTFSIRKHCHTK